MNAILRQLAIRNRFRFRKIETKEIPDDRPNQAAPLGWFQDNLSKILGSN